MLSTFPPTWSILTPRERQVATLICQGYINRQIARAIPPATSLMSPPSWQKWMVSHTRSSPLS